MTYITLAALGTGTYHGTIYHLPAAPMPWLFPVLAICGLALQVVAIYRGKVEILALGLLITLVAALAEKDICLFTGDIVAAACIWLLRKNRL